MRRESFNLLHHHIRGRRTAPFIDDIIVQSEKLTEFLPRLNQILSQYNILYTVAGHNDGLIRTPFLRQMYGEKVYRLFEETKKIFDPQNIFNPGKKVGTDLQTALKYLRTKN